MLLNEKTATVLPPLLKKTPVATVLPLGSLRTGALRFVLVSTVYVPDWVKGLVPE